MTKKSKPTSYIVVGVSRAKKSRTVVLEYFAVIAQSRAVVSTTNRIVMASSFTGNREVDRWVAFINEERPIQESFGRRILAARCVTEDEAMQFEQTINEEK